MPIMSALLASGVITNSSAPSMGYINRYNASSGALNVTLPTLSLQNIGARTVLQKDTLDTSSNTITFTTHSGDTFDDGTTTVVLQSTGQQILLQVVVISGTRYWKVVGPQLGSPGRVALSALANGTTTGNAIRSNGTSWVSATVPTLYVNDYGADPTGATASDTAVAAAITAMGTQPGILEFGVGTYKLNNTITFSHRGQGITGQGSALTTIDFRGTGDCLRIYDSLSPDTTQFGGSGKAGHITGLMITGVNNTNTNICGLHIGDIYAPYIYDLDIRHFNTTGAKGFWMEQALGGCSERAFCQFSVWDCTNCVTFSRNASNPRSNVSCSYSEYFISLLCNANQNGITLTGGTGGVWLYGVKLYVVANFESGNSSNTGVALTVGTGSGDTSRIAGELIFCCEQNNDPGYGTPIGHTDINIGTNAGATIEAVGSLNFNSSSGSGVFVAGTAVPGSNLLFSGYAQCPCVGAPGLGAGVVLANGVGAVSFANNGMLAPCQGATDGSETYTIVSGSVTAILGTTISSAAYSPQVGDRILIATAPTATGAGGGVNSITNHVANGIYTVTGNTTNLSFSRSADMSGTVNPAGKSTFVQGNNTLLANNVMTATAPLTGGWATSGYGASGNNIFWSSVAGLNPLFGTVSLNATPAIKMWNGTGNTALQPTASSGGQTLTFPATATSDTLVGRNSTDTLTNKTLSYSNNSIGAQTAIASEFSLASSTTETAIVSLTLPTGTIVAGSTYRITVRGTVQVAATSGTLTLNPYMGANVSTETFQMASQTAAAGPVPFYLVMDMTCRTTGSSGTYIANGYGRIEFATPVTLSTTTTTTATVNTTASSPVVKLTATWATSSASNSLKVETAVIEQVV